MTRLLPAAAISALVLAMAMAGCGSGSGSTNTAATAPAVEAPKDGGVMPAAVVDPYVKVADALAKDSLEGVKANAGTVATAATALGAPAMKIDTAAVQLASATEIADAREKFAVLSDAVDAYMEGLHLKAPEGTKVAFCPMKGKTWMQKDGAIANPYFGSSMLTCGSFR